MATKKIAAHITLDNEKEFKTSITSCNKSLAAMKSEMNLVEAQTAGTANKLKTLEKKHEVLSKTVDKHKEKEVVLREALAKAEEQYARVDSELSEYKNSLEKAESELKSMEKSSDTTKEALEEQRQTVKGLKDTVEKGEVVYQKAGDRVNNWKKQLNNAEAQTIKATKALQQNDVYLEEAQKSWKGAAKSIDKFGEKTSSLEKKITGVGKTIKENLVNTVVEAGKAMVSEAASGALELEEAQSKLAASTGLTAQEMESYTKEIEELYKTGYGDSVADIADNMALVKQYTGEVDSTKIKELTENAMALDDTFSNMDISETLRGVDALMKNMGLTAEEAFDYITVGAQNGLNKSGELTDNIAEYAQLWGQAGFSAEEMFTILDNGLSSGAYNLDKVNDFVKEFGNSLADGRIESNLSSFSAGTQDLFYQWKSGEATTRDVFYSVISDLESMTNQQTALTIASNTWSALGEDNAMTVITALNDLNGTYADVQDSMEELKKVRYDNVISQYKQLGRTLQTDAIQPILTKVLPLMQGVTEIATENATAIAGVGTAIGAAYTVNKVRKFTEELNLSKEAIERHVELLKNAATKLFDYEGAASKVTVIQNVLNSSMLANPAVLVTAGIVGLCTVLAVMGAESHNVAIMTDELCAKAYELNDSVRAASEGLQESCKDMETSLSSVESKEGAAEGLIRELYELDSVTEKSDFQISRMVTIVGELNNMFPDLSLSIDKNTGSLSKNEKQTRSSINTALQYAKAQAAQEKMAEIAAEMAEADMARYEAEKNIEEIDKKIAKAEEERAKAGKKAADTAKESTQQSSSYAAALQNEDNEVTALTNEINNLKEAKEAQNEEIKELNKSYEEANEKYVQACDYTESLTAATEENTKAGEKKNEQSKTSIELAGQELEAYSALAAGQQELAVSVTNGILEMQESVQSALESQMDMFEEFDGGVEISSEKLLSNMQSQIDGVANWEKNLSELADKGINQGILQKLAAMGPEGSGYVAAFNSMTSEEIAKANGLWEESLDVKGMTDTWGQQLTTSGAANIAGGMDNLTSVMQQSGANTVQGLVDGMQNAQKLAENAGTDLGVKTVESVNEGLGCQSPSKKTKESGKNVNLGLVNGLKENKNLVTDAAKTVAKSAVETVDKTLSGNCMKKYGKNISSSLALGIIEGKSEVVKAATEVAAAAITAAKNKLEIHSPSKVFRGMGNNTMESYALGTKERKKYVMDSVTDTLDFRTLSGKIRTDNLSIQSEYGMMGQIFAECMKNVELNAYMDGKKVSRQMSRMGVVFGA